MRVLHKVLAIVALLFLIADSARIAYVRWFDPPLSQENGAARALGWNHIDRKLAIQIESARTVEELITPYEPLRQQLDENLKANRKDPALEASTGALQGAITEWATDSKKLRELRFYWFVGLGVFFVGLGAYRFINRWLGTGLLIAAFFEFIYSTTGETQTYSLARVREFDRLLTNEFLFCLVSLALLFVTIWMLDIFRSVLRDAAVELKSL